MSLKFFIFLIYIYIKNLFEILLYYYLKYIKYILKKVLEKKQEYSYKYNNLLNTCHAARLYM